MFRACQSAQILADALGIAKVQENPELMERDFGESEGHLVKGLDDEQRRLLMEVGETEDHLVQRGVNALFKISVQHPQTASDNSKYYVYGANAHWLPWGAMTSSAGMRRVPRGCDSP